MASVAPSYAKLVRSTSAVATPLRSLFRRRHRVRIRPSVQMELMDTFGHIVVFLDVETAVELAKAFKTARSVVYQKARAQVQNHRFRVLASDVIVSDVTEWLYNLELVIDMALLSPVVVSLLEEKVEANFAHISRVEWADATNIEAVAARPGFGLVLNRVSVLTGLESSQMAAISMFPALESLSLVLDNHVHVADLVGFSLKELTVSTSKEDMVRLVVPLSLRVLKVDIKRLDLDSYDFPQLRHLEFTNLSVLKWEPNFVPFLETLIVRFSTAASAQSMSPTLEALLDSVDSSKREVLLSSLTRLTVENFEHDYLMSSMTKLTSLELINGRVDQFDGTYYHRLRRLVARDCQLEVVSKLPKMDEIDLSGNVLCAKLPVFPVAKLTLDHNPLRHNLQLMGMVELSLNYCGLKAFPTNLPPLLRELSVRGNKLVTVPSLEAYHHLVRLDLGDNQLRMVDVRIRLNSLSVLGNPIEELAMENLPELDFHANNKLRTMYLRSEKKWLLRSTIQQGKGGEPNRLSPYSARIDAKLAEILEFPKTITSVTVMVHDFCNLLKVKLPPALERLIIHGQTLGPYVRMPQSLAKLERLHRVKLQGLTLSVPLQLPPGIVSLEMRACITDRIQIRWSGNRPRLRYLVLHCVNHQREPVKWSYNDIGHRCSLDDLRVIEADTPPFAGTEPPRLMGVVRARGENGAFSK
ncbi:hypothetical protein DICA1_C12574 [Diutina catenulata]